MMLNGFLPFAPPTARTALEGGHSFGLFTVADGLAIRNGRQCLPSGFLKICTFDSFQRQFEFDTSPVYSPFVSAFSLKA